MAINLHRDTWTLRDLVDAYADLEGQRDALAKQVSALWVKANCLDDVIGRIRRGGVTLVELVQVIDERVGLFAEVAR
jgi:hypothetical protein